MWTENSSGKIGTNVIDRSYDSYGRSSGFAMGDDYAVSYGFDSLGKFSQISNVQFQVSYSYLQNSDLISGLTSDLGSLTSHVTRSYESTRDLLTQVKNEADGSTLSQFDYENDAIGRRMRRVDNSALTNQFAYNTRSELTSAGMGTNQFGYQYDPIGNRKTAVTDGETKQYTANSVNQYILIANGETNTLAYDADGNLTNDSRFVYTWDAENRLIGVEPLSLTNDAFKVVFAYDYMSRRVSKEVSNLVSGQWTVVSSHAFIYDSWNMIRETSYSETPTLNYTNTYIWGLDLSGSLQGAGGIGGLLAATLGTNSVVYYYDGNGNVSELINTADNSLAAHYEYSPFGETLVATGPLAKENKFRFSTKYFDDESGLSYYGYRYYSPSLGRWLSRDPIGEMGGWNLYGFVDNDVTDYVDTKGKGKYSPSSGGRNVPPGGVSFPAPGRSGGGSSVPPSPGSGSGSSVPSCPSCGNNNPVPPCAPYPDCLYPPPSPPSEGVQGDSVMKESMKMGIKK